MLHGVKAVFGFRQTLDRRHRPSSHGCGEREARQNANAVDVNRAGAALAVVAAFFRSRQTDVFPQGVEKARADVKRHAMLEFR